jgi:hypothetical protein
MPFGGGNLKCAPVYWANKSKVRWRLVYFYGRALPMTVMATRPSVNRQAAAAAFVKRFNYLWGQRAIVMM